MKSWYFLLYIDSCKPVKRIFSGKKIKDLLHKQFKQPLRLWIVRTKIYD